MRGESAHGTVETGTQWSEHCRGLREWAEGILSPTVENGFNHCSLLRERVGLEPPASIGTSESGCLPIPQIFTFAFSQSWEQLYELSNPHFKVDEEQTDVTCRDNALDHIMMMTIIIAPKCNG